MKKAPLERFLKKTAFRLDEFDTLMVNKGVFCAAERSAAFLLAFFSHYTIIF